MWRISRPTDFREVLSDILEVGEKGITDGGNKGEENMYAKGYFKEAFLMNAAVRARYETVDSYLKICKVFSTGFRHDLCVYPQCFYAVSNLVQLGLEYEVLFFQVEYNE